MASKSGYSLRVGLGEVDLIEIEPLGGKILDEAAAAAPGEQPLDLLRAAWRARAVGRRRPVASSRASGVLPVSR